ncbi:glutamate synthase-related protein [Streptomyces sp. NPDC001817]|uniref:glutamate synthase-related protein n=1 Tax=Streptomyces sp. NPDC001817 TaxID=3154398 RepID=UPI003328FBEB
MSVNSNSPPQHHSPSNRQRQKPPSPAPLAVERNICHTNACPVGLATQDPRRASALNVHETHKSGVFYTMSSTDSALSSTPAGSQPSSSRHTRIPECATTDLDSPKYEAGQTFTDGLEPWLSAWLAVGQENR